MRKLANKHISKITPYQPGKPTEEVKRELGLKQVIKLASNENPLPPSVKVISAIKDAARLVNRYPESSCFYLKKALAGKLGVGEENLIFGNGSDEILDLIIKAFASPSCEVLTASVTFLEYKITAQIHGIKVKEVPLRNFKFDLDAMKNAMGKRTKLVFISNPNNPTGTYVSSRELDLFLRSLPGSCLLVVDEAYIDFVDKKDFPNTLKYLERENIIILRTFSKAYGLAGLRIGYGIANRDLIKAVDNVRQPFNVNSIAQAAALAALSDTAYVKQVRSTILKGKRFLCSQLDRLGLEYLPSAANFILINVNCSAKKLFRKMLYAGVIVRPMDMYGLNNYIRVTVGTMDENKMFIDTLSRSLK